MEKNLQKKKQRLRNNEYYNTQEISDKLYSLSKRGYKFRDLIQLIEDRQNIMLAYRNIKKIRVVTPKGLIRMSLRTLVKKYLMS